jgi:site-specific DNA-methyltransferase (adenine-specific)
MKETNHTIFVCDNKHLDEIADSSVHLVVTSPPYVTTEFKKGQTFDYIGFLENFQETCSKLFRVVVPGGRFALNVADMVTKYRDTDGYMSRAPFGADTLKACEAAGFRLFERFIWDKGFTRNFGGPLLGSFPYPLTLFNNNYFEYIYVFRKPGARKTKQDIREKSRVTLDEWRKWSQQWWRVESMTEKIDFHRAVYPLEIPYRLIRMYSYEGDMILDPYAGTGATNMAAYLAGRSSIGFEVDAECPTLVSKRVEYELRRNPMLSEFKVAFGGRDVGIGEMESRTLES